MGIFKGRQVFTSTVAYNLAGPEENRANYLKSAVVARTLSNSRLSMTDFLNSTYMNGPGARLSRFHRWALNNYQDIGVPGQIKLTINEALASDIGFAISTLGSIPVVVTGSEIAYGNWVYWADQYMMANHRSVINTAWTADISEDNSVITITFEDGSTASFQPDNYDPEALYIYATYYRSFPQSVFQTTTAFDEEAEVEVWIYKIGSGDPVLDTLAEKQTDLNDAYFPVIPVRYDNEFISPDYRSNLYPLAKKALRKAVDADYDELQTRLEEENPDSIGDIDYAYVVFGTPLNVKEPAAKRYLWDSLLEIVALEEGTDWGSIWDTWTTKQDVAKTEFETWRTYEEAPYEEDGVTPLDPVPMPEGRPSRPWRGIQIRPPHSGPAWDTNYDVRITWATASKDSGSGLYSPGAQVGDIWWATGTPYNWSVDVYDGTIDESSSRVENELFLVWQKTETTWERIRVLGLKQQTRVFGDHYEELDAADEIGKTEESAFIWPLKYSTFKGLSFTDQTQITTSCTYLTLHTYEIYVQRWYQTIALQLVFVVVMISITAATGGLGAASAGLLGTNSAVGAAFGLTGTAAIAVGYITNYIASIVLSSLVMKASSVVFGEKVGAIVGTFAALIAINAVSNLMVNGNLALNFGNLTSAANLMKLTNAGVGAYTRYVNAATQEILLETQEMLEEHKEKMEELSELYAENIGYGNGMIDPMILTDAQDIFAESPDSFFSRTLMTGSDIAELTHELLSNFTEMTLKTESSLS